MKDNSTSPFAYENAFSLILSLQEQIQHIKPSGENAVEDLSNKFSRLSKLTIGELEFARRMGYEQIPCTRISPYPILWNDYDQPIPMDFIILLNNKRYCVDVKYYDWKKLSKEFIISKTVINTIGKFRDFHHYDGGLIGLKRFEKWYLFDIVDLKKSASNKGKVFSISFTELEKINLLNEKHICFNTGTGANHQTDIYDPHPKSTFGGIYVKTIESKDEHIKFQFSTDSIAEQEDLLTYRGTQAIVLNSLYNKINNNLNLICKEFGNFAEVNNFTDSLPTAFTLSDRIQNVNSEKKLKEDYLNNFTKMKLVFHDKGNSLRFYYQRLYYILTYEMRQEMKEKQSEIF